MHSHFFPLPARAQSRRLSRWQREEQSGQPTGQRPPWIVGVPLKCAAQRNVSDVRSTKIFLIFFELRGLSEDFGKSKIAAYFARCNRDPVRQVRPKVFPQFLIAPRRKESCCLFSELSYLGSGRKSMPPSLRLSLIGSKRKMRLSRIPLREISGRSFTRSNDRHCR